MIASRAWHQDNAGDGGIKRVRVPCLACDVGLILLRSQQLQCRPDYASVAKLYARAVARARAHLTFLS